MGEKLSQSQIDALLNAVRSGEKDMSKSDDEKAESKYRKYDFSSPRKFTRDRIKMLRGIYENYARIINSRLNTRLRTNCEITVESVEEQHYYEFSNSLTEGDVLAMADVLIKDQAHDVPVLTYLDIPTSLSMMDRLMGGEGDIDEEDLGGDYSFTDVELHLYEDLVEDMITVMGSSWENYIPIKFHYDKTDVNPTMSQTVGLDEIVVIIDLKMKFPNIEGRLNICLPGEMLVSVFAEISRENPVRKVKAESKAEEIFDTLRDSDLEIIAELGTTQLSISDIYHLNVGDVIDIGRSKESTISLEIGGYQWFTGRMGMHKKNLAVKIDSVCYPVE